MFCACIIEFAHWRGFDYLFILVEISQPMKRKMVQYFRCRTSTVFCIGFGNLKISTSQYFLKLIKIPEISRKFTIFQKTSETSFGTECFSQPHTSMKLHNAMELSTRTKKVSLIWRIDFRAIVVNFCPKLHSKICRKLVFLLFFVQIRYLRLFLEIYLEKSCKNHIKS